ncbi:MAG: hypothetical protein GF334_09135 [Candidatus Altiarchaeales archaeon]|nr:hypothetical protein [Candidatus Altiarchaeales archaeon]
MIVLTDLISKIEDDFLRYEIERVLYRIGILNTEPSETLLFSADRARKNANDYHKKRAQVDPFYRASRFTPGQWAQLIKDNELAQDLYKEMAKSTLIQVLKEVQRLSLDGKSNCRVSWNVKVPQEASDMRDSVLGYLQKDLEDQGFRVEIDGNTNSIFVHWGY